MRVSPPLPKVLVMQQEKYENYSEPKAKMENEKVLPRPFWLSWLELLSLRPKGCGFDS